MIISKSIKLSKEEVQDLERIAKINYVDIAEPCFVNDDYNSYIEKLINHKYNNN